MIPHLVACLVAVVVAVGPGRLHAQEPRPLARLAWLQGCWLSSSPRRTIDEHWLPPRGHTMIGVSRTVRGDSLVEFEVVVLRERGTALVYEAHPSGQASAEFTAERVGDSSVVFANPAHDFPQRVGYRRIGPDSLVAWIEGSRSGQTHTIEFPYARTDCPR